MLRLTEIALFLVPFALYAGWLVAGRTAPRWAVWAALAGILSLAAATIWFGLDHSAPPGSVYLPARIENGTIVPGRIEEPRR